MLITIHVSLPMADAQGVKESVAARLEDMGSVVRVVEIQDDGYGKQQSFMESVQQSKPESQQEDLYPEAMRYVREWQAKQNRG